jgi:hypothetical protein
MTSRSGFSLSVMCAFGASASLVVALVLAPGAEATVWEVDTVSEIQNAINSWAQPYDTVNIAAGTYNLTSRLNVYDHHLTIQGATGNRDDVVLVGGGMNTNASPTEIIDLHTDDVTIRDLTLKEAYYHGIHVRTEQDVDRTTVSNVKIVDCGERFIKGSGAGLGYVSEDILIENCYLLQTKPKTYGDVDYIGGMDMMALDGCVIRDCVIQDIKGAGGGGRGGIFLWNQCTDCTAERNLIIGCDRSICYGNPSGTPPHMTGGIIRNNFIVRGAGIALELCKTENLKVYNNTVYSPDSGYFRTVHINDSSTINLHLAYNIIRGQILESSGGTATYTGNIIGSTPASNWFVDPLNGDLHLTELASLAIDGGLSLAEVTDDFDGQARDAWPDVGGDERASVAGDLDGDGDVDLDDYILFEADMGGPEVSISSDADLDEDGDVDLGDWAMFADLLAG